MGSNVPISANVLSVPRYPIVATEKRFIFQQPICLMLKEKIFSWSGDDFTITDTNGSPFFKCEAINGFGQKKVLLDNYKSPIYTIKHEIFSLRGRFKFYYGRNGDKVLVSVDPITKFKSLYSVTFLNVATGKMNIEN